MRHQSINIGGVLAGALLAAGTATAGQVSGGAINDFNRGDTLTASDLNDNFERLRKGVSDNARSMPWINGFQEVSFSNPVNITTTTWTQIQGVTISAGNDPVDISFNAHVVVEGDSLDGSDRYRFGICKGSASNANLVGAGWWRPGATSNQYQAMTISFTGYDTGVVGDVTYSLCGAKLNTVDQDVTVYRRGLTATIVPQ